MFRIRKRPQRCTLCRHRAVFGLKFGQHIVSCPDCGRHTWGHPQRAQAIAAWNGMA